jgi:uncharacterized protein (TIGR01777 family)
MNIVMTGARGMIGSAVCRPLLAQGHRVTSLSRSAPPKRAGGGLDHVRWDGRSRGEWESCIDGADAVINLAGEPIAGGRWTESRKALIIGSRLDAANAIVGAISRTARKPALLINASAVGYYGDVPEGEVTETHRPGSGFLSETCLRWEDAALEAKKHVARVVLLRTGIVLDANGGALPKLAMPFRFFAGGIVGSGRQWMPWIHRDDVAGIILHALSTDALDGPINVSAPGPLRMNEFCAQLARVLQRPSWLPVPSFALRLLLGEMAGLVLGGQRAIPEKVIASGYRFQFNTLEEALRELFSRQSKL